MRTHLAIFFVDRGDVPVLKTRDKIAQPDGLALLAIRGNGHTWPMPAILYADRRDRRIKSPSVSLA